MLYVTEVAGQFLARCRNITILSPADFSIIAEWEKQEIPLAVILRSIDDLCGEINDESSEIESIGYFKATVKQNFIDWLKTEAERKIS